MEPLTRRQRDVLNYIAEVHASRSSAPTLREIASAFGVCVGTVQNYLRALVRKGYVSVDTYARRGIRLVRSRRDWKVQQHWQGDFEKRVGAKLAGAADLPAIFAITGDDLRAWLDVDRCDLFVHDSQGHELRGGAFFGATAPEGASGKPGAGPADVRTTTSAGADPDPMVSAAFRRRRPVIGRIAEGADRRPAAAIPLLGRDRALGVLWLRDRRGAAGFDEAKTSRAALAAAALVPALEQGTLHADLQRRIRLQAALVQLCRAINSVRDFQKVLHDVYDIVLGLVDSPAFVIAVQDDTGQWWMLLETDILDGVRVERNRPRPVNLGNTEAIRAIRTSPFWIRHRTEEEIRVLEGRGPDVRDGGMGAIGHRHKRSRSFLYVPLKREGEMIGYLSAQSYRYDAYTVQDAENLILIGEYIGLAVQNALREELARAQHALERRRLERLDRLEEDLRKIAGAAEQGTRGKLETLAAELTSLREERPEDPTRYLTQ